MSQSNCLFVFVMFIGSMVFAESSNNTDHYTYSVELPTTIQFDQHAYDVKDTLDPMLLFIADYLKEKTSITKLRIEGHVYTEKSPEENLKLSLQRAAMISYYLTEKGIDCQRLIPVAFGDTKPIAPLDECNLLTNTRIGFYIAELNNKSTPGNAADGYAKKRFNPCEY
jgi:OOP family OmpA-OmpF porin